LVGNLEACVGRQVGLGAALLGDDCIAIEERRNRLRILGVQVSAMTSSVLASSSLSNGPADGGALVSVVGDVVGLAEEAAAQVGLCWTQDAPLLVTKPSERELLRNLYWPVTSSLSCTLVLPGFIGWLLAGAAGESPANRSSEPVSNDTPMQSYRPLSYVSRFGAVIIANGQHRPCLVTSPIPSGGNWLAEEQWWVSFFCIACGLKAVERETAGSSNCF